MSNLISANVLRLRQYRVFWIALGGVFLVSLFFMWGTSRSVAEMAQLGLDQPVDKYFFSMASYMGVVYAAFISLFLGPELADGAVRNKLIAGHTRTKVYLADYLVCLGACLAIAIMWLLGSLPGLFWIGPFSMQPGMVTAYLFIVVGFTAAFAAVFVLIGLASDNKAITVVLSLILWLGLLLLASAFFDRLHEPEMNGGVMYENGAFKEVNPEPNPLYLTGMARKICTWILEFLPTGQTQLMYSNEIVSPVRQIIFSVLFTAIVLWAGIKMFQKKDIK